MLVNTCPPQLLVISFHSFEAENPSAISSFKLQKIILFNLYKPRIAYQL